MKKLHLKDLKPVKVLSTDEQRAIKGGKVYTCICQNDSESNELIISCETATECIAGCQALCG